jgi:hypothetical protein
MGVHRRLQTPLNSWFPVPRVPFSSPEFLGVAVRTAVKPLKQMAQVPRQAVLSPYCSEEIER